MDATVPELKDKMIQALIEDQINDLSGAATPIEVKVFGPDLAVLRKLATQVGDLVKQTGPPTSTPTSSLGNPDIVMRPDSGRRPGSA